jgi:hypothetical protein
MLNPRAIEGIPGWRDGFRAAPNGHPVFVRQEQILGDPGFHEPDTATEAQQTRPQVARISSLALCAPLGKLGVESGWVWRHRRFGLGASPATPISVAAPYFSTQRSQSGAQRSQSRLLLRPAVAVGRWRSERYRYSTGLCVHDDEGLLNKPSFRLMNTTSH